MGECAIVSKIHSAVLHCRSTELPDNATAESCSLPQVNGNESHPMPCFLPRMYRCRQGSAIEGLITKRGVDLEELLLHSTFWCALSVLLKVMSNVVEHPAEQKYRQVLFLHAYYCMAYTCLGAHHRSTSLCVTWGRG